MSANEGVCMLSITPFIIEDFCSLNKGYVEQPICLTVHHSIGGQLFSNALTLLFYVVMMRYVRFGIIFYCTVHCQANTLPH